MKSKRRSFSLFWQMRLQIAPMWKKWLSFYDFVITSCQYERSFLVLFHVKKGLSGEALAEESTGFVKHIGLRMEDCRGQGYDGAGNMVGKLSGVAARIQRSHDKAIYVHCGSHVLNLCVASSCRIDVVRNMMDNVRAVSDFFNISPKRVLSHLSVYVLKEKIKELVPAARRQKLLNVCHTRWLQELMV